MLTKIPILMLTPDSEPSQKFQPQYLEPGVCITKWHSSEELVKVVDALSVFSTWEPAKEVSQQSSVPGESMRLQPLRILLAEDLEDNRDLLELFLKETPHSLETVENGAMAVEKFQTGSYDLVLMDIQMPCMDGYQATKIIRQWEQDQDRVPTPIIALTANAFTDEIENSFNAGCNAHLTKPIKKNVLLNVIQEYGSCKLGVRT